MDLRSEDGSVRSNIELYFLIWVGFTEEHHENCRRIWIGDWLQWEQRLVCHQAPVGIHHADHEIQRQVVWRLNISVHDGCSRQTLEPAKAFQDVDNCTDAQLTQTASDWKSAPRAETMKAAAVAIFESQSPFKHAKSLRVKGIQDRGWRQLAGRCFKVLRDRSPAYVDVGHRFSNPLAGSETAGRWGLLNINLEPVECLVDLNCNH